MRLYKIIVKYKNKLCPKIEPLRMKQLLLLFMFEYNLTKVGLINVCQRAVNLISNGQLMVILYYFVIMSMILPYKAIIVYANC